MDTQVGTDMYPWIVQGICKEDWDRNCAIDKLSWTHKPKWVIYLAQKMREEILDLRVEKCKLQLENRKLKDVIIQNGLKPDMAS